jgi:hypothetical protein
MLTKYIENKPLNDTIHQRKETNKNMIHLLSKKKINNIETLEYMDESLFKCQFLDSPSFVTRGDNEAQRMTKLSPDFTPGSFDVICAWGGEAKIHEGNINFG